MALRRQGYFEYKFIFEKSLIGGGRHRGVFRIGVKFRPNPRIYKYFRDSSLRSNFTGAYPREPTSAFKPKLEKWWNDMKCLFIGLLALSLHVATPVFADEDIIAHGENPQGKSFFAYTGLVSKKDAGWQNTSMNKGIFEVVLNDSVLDVRFVDASKSIKSVREQGGNVTTLNKGAKEATILVAYPAETIETYTFYTDNEGQNKFIMTQVKSRPNALITQSSIFTGACRFVEFDKFPD